MQLTLFRAIIEELAYLVDQSLIPQTTTAHIGMRLVGDLEACMENIEHGSDGKPMLSSYLDAVINLHDRLGCGLYADSIQSDLIKFRAKTCPFKSSLSLSLCTMMSGIIGGITYNTFGYSKMCLVRDTENPDAPCGCDIYINPTQEALERIGVEYTKTSSGLLKGGDEKYIAAQRHSRRKLILGLFSNVAHAIRNCSSHKQVIEEFIESISCIPEIRIAAFYLYDSQNGNYSLAAHLGIPQELLPVISIVQREKDSDKKPDSKEILNLVEDFNGERTSIASKTQVRSYSSINIKEKGRFIGILNIGWKSSLPISPEMSEGLRAACDMLGLCLNQKETQNELEDAYSINISILNELVKTVDRYSMNHSQRVADLSREIALEMKVPESDIALLYKAALLHDVGKICVPSNILNKEGPLDDEEYKIVCEHPVVGAKLVSPVSSLRNTAPIILHHHERLDGSGYPDGLTSEFIPLLIRILAVADAFDAMTTARSYRASLKISEALEEILKDSGTKFDPEVVAALNLTLKKKVNIEPEAAQVVKAPKLSLIQSIMQAARKESTPA